MKVVLDTNVIVSALLTPSGNASRILDLVIRGDLALLFDDRILTEYRKVLLRPKFGFVAGDVDLVISFLESAGTKIVSSVLDEPSVSLDDVQFLEVAVTGAVDVLISGNKKHFKMKTKRNLRIMNPTEFMEFWRRHSRPNAPIRKTSGADKD